MCSIASSFLFIVSFVFPEQLSETLLPKQKCLPLVSIYFILFIFCDAGD
jgi:hypothetical protein